ncbi:MAG: hypothetical protein ACREIT_10255, partial [Tepidisphaeraceae bacterium]
MADLPGVTRAQTKFLRAFRNHPNGPGASEWPSPWTFRRWMRREGFRAAMASLRETLRLQSDLHLTTAAATAARTL